MSLTLPSFDEKGNISMSAVINARPRDFIALGIDVGFHLHIMRETLAIIPAATYCKDKSSHIHGLLRATEGEEGKNRQPGYQLPAVYCFYYNLYSMFFGGMLYHNLTDAECKEFDQSILNCEITAALNPDAMIGRYTGKAKDYKGKKIIIPKDTKVRNLHYGPSTTKRRVRVTCHHVTEGFYHNGTVQHPMVEWAGKGGYWTRTPASEVILAAD